MSVLICTALAGFLCKAQADISRIIKHQYPVCSVRFSANGKYLAIAGGQAILIWDMEKDRRFKSRFVGFWMSAMDVASHGNYLAVGGNSVITEIYQIEKIHKKPVERLVSDMAGFIDFSSDGQWLAVRSLKDKDTTKVFDLANNKHITLKHPAVNLWNTLPCLFSPNSKYLAVAADPVIMWEVGSWQKKAQLGGTDSGIAFSPTSLTLAHGTLKNNRTIILWRTKDGSKRMTLKSKEIGQSVYMAFSPRGNYLAVAKRSHSVIEIWNLRKKRVVKTLEGHRGMITTLDFSPDGNWLASGANDKDVILWDISSLADSDIQAADAAGTPATTWGKLKDTGMAK